MNTYVTLLSSDSYLEGTLVLARSLALTNPAYPLLVMVSPSVSVTVRQRLKDFVLKPQLLSGKYQIPPAVLDRMNTARWAGTFDKLKLFRACLKISGIKSR
ncbi:MAG: hypothetical protein WA952_12125 [Lewinella sp.]